MAATRKPRQRRQHERSVKLIIPACNEQPACVRITQDGKAAHYWISPLASDWGLAYRFERAGEEATEAVGESYDVLLENEQDASCTCPGHTFGGYCKHVDATRALLAAGKLALPAVPNAPVAEHASRENCPKCGSADFAWDNSERATCQQQGCGTVWEPFGAAESVDPT